MQPAWAQAGEGEGSRPWAGPPAEVVQKCGMGIEKGKKLFYFSKEVLSRVFTKLIKTLG